MTSVTTDPVALADRWTRWRAEREERLRDPHGCLSLTALHWLDLIPVHLDDVPGTWSADADGVVVTAERGDGLSVAGRTIDGTVRLSPADNAPGIDDRAAVRTGDRVIEVIRRGDAYGLRVRDPQAATLVDFTGVPAYEPSPDWVLTGTFEPFEAPATVTTATVAARLTQEHRARGRIRFRAGGSEHVLTAFAASTGGDADGGGLSLLFTDATSGVTTYGRSRRLLVDEPGFDGAVVLDFNRTFNLPCAFTDYATCPLPPRENVLTVAVEAGEKQPRSS